ncbi:MULTISPECIES: NAD-dependent epimerase/dehydratase family protein [Streptomyces]|uniref:NAD(P)-dependent oxidoreductase n=1 Tax=Streptomyces longisporus TaxID=1948 RepID=A0ABP6AFA1_STRLO
MHIAVTGAAGKLGRAVVEDLRRAGHVVFALDRIRFPDTAAESTVIDMTDYGQVVEAFTGVDARPRGIDAVVHLAAIPGPGLAANAALFTNNITSTYNVFSAARLAGITTIVWASSETVLGIPFETAPPYLPVDEEYAARPESSYSLGKALEETMAEHFARWTPDLSIIGLRFSNVMDDSDYPGFETWQDDPDTRSWNLWGYIDARDGARAVRLAVESDRKGADTFIIAAADTVMRRPTSELITGRLASVERWSGLEGRASLLSTGKARRVLGYVPQVSWLDRI